jgi:hypothetical protein
VEAFEKTLGREDFYDFYGLVTAMSSPACGDRIYVDNQPYNLKKIVRKIRITVMHPRFNVDYAPAYTYLTANQDLSSLMTLRLKLINSSLEAASVDKLIGALQVILKSRAHETGFTLSE